MSNLNRSAWLLICSLCLPSCTSILDKDFRKATFVGEIAFGGPALLKRDIPVPDGSGTIILAVPGHRCSPLTDAPISWAIRRNDRILLSERVRLSELTWSYGDGCDAYGYIRGHKSEVEIKDSGTILTFEVDASMVKSASAR